MPEMHRRAPQPNPIGARSLPAPPQRLTVSPPPHAFQTFSGLWAPGPGLRVLSPGGSTRAAMVYCGAFSLVTCTSVWW